MFNILFRFAPLLARHKKLKTYRQRGLHRLSCYTNMPDKQVIKNQSVAGGGIVVRTRFGPKSQASFTFFFCIPSDLVLITCRFPRSPVTVCKPFLGSRGGKYYVVGHHVRICVWCTPSAKVVRTQQHRTALVAVKLLVYIYLPGVWEVKVFPVASCLFCGPSY